MNCRVLDAPDFVRDTPLRLFVARKLCKPGSAFQRALFDGKVVQGHIAIVEDQGEVIGWARTEPWPEGGGFPRELLVWHTLEAFVDHPYRGSGVAKFASAGLVASIFWGDDRAVAVFHPYMMLLASKVGLQPTLFRETPGKGWVRA